MDSWHGGMLQSPNEIRYKIRVRDGPIADTHEKIIILKEVRLKKEGNRKHVPFYCMNQHLGVKRLCESGSVI